MPQKTKVGLQLSVGGLGDLSFNDSAYAGLQEAQQLHGIEFQTAVWENPMLNAVNLENWAKEGFDLIVGIGYGNAAPLSEVAARYPQQRFASVDVAAEGQNVWSATYREYEGDFVVGVLAALVTQTHMVGFMGGGVTPVVRRIELGFAQGVKNVDSSISFISDYVGEFDDPLKGRLLAETQYTLGVDVIYQVAGRCGIGAIEAANEFGRWIISTGGDHSDLAPNAVLTSRIKNVGKPILDVIESVVAGRFEGGVIKSYGFAEGGLMMAPIRPSVFKIVTPAIQNIMQEVQAQVISGKIKVELEE
ncbi:MAG: BMP family ABC transporter substrate-binding protein [Chloroflexota bacterium]|nr:MAG: BMP family ABC transporter substrate-binding protein [Chloroflexota bacterium]